nr:hypothetical protein [Cupriavidus necator]
MTKEHAILFSGAMVRAILDGGKSSTQRLGRLQNSRESCSSAQEKRYRLAVYQPALSEEHGYEGSLPSTIFAVSHCP